MVQIWWLKLIIRLLLLGLGLLFDGRGGSRLQIHSGVLLLSVGIMNVELKQCCLAEALGAART